ncbi:ABC transporter ATP-binding protein [Carboxylicivirga sp. RSCT41]|uniref:ABC transporter ATP-binding protein n=1 Tax=Carboxylicivirga agarovorans TaxID=3417570 RepID=UPI003D325070
MINIRNLRFSWSDQDTSLFNFHSLSVIQGEHLFLSGPSGSGKSTLLNLIGGVIVPQKGEVEILGTVINKLKDAERDSFRADHIGYIFQQFNLVPYLSVVDNITLPCRFSGRRYRAAMHQSKSIREEAVRLLERLGMDINAMNKPVTELSTGQQQRVAAARALIGKPEIVIADEPTSALDAHTQEAFLNLLFYEARSWNTTIVFVSHDQRLAKLFDRTEEIGNLNGKRDLILEKDIV